MVHSLTTPIAIQLLGVRAGGDREVHEGGARICPLDLERGARRIAEKARVKPPRIVLSRPRAGSWAIAMRKRSKGRL